MLPLSKPVLATVALFSIQHHWNAFIGPLIYLHDLDKFTAAIGLRYFVTDTQVHYNLQMAASAALHDTDYHYVLFRAAILHPRYLCSPG